MAAKNRKRAWVIFDEAGYPVHIGATRAACFDSIDGGAGGWWAWREAGWTLRRVTLVPS